MYRLAAIAAAGALGYLAYDAAGGGPLGAGIAAVVRHVVRNLG